MANTPITIPAVASTLSPLLLVPKVPALLLPTAFGAPGVCLLVGNMVGFDTGLGVGKAVDGNAEMETTGELVGPRVGAPHIVTPCVVTAAKSPPRLRSSR